MNENPYQSPNANLDDHKPHNIADLYTRPPILAEQPNRQREFLSTILLVIGIIVVAAIIFIISIPV